MGAIMVLIIVALSRISMRIINGLEEGIELFDTEVEYIARPPRRNLAMLTITFYTLLELLIPGNPVTGWVALAAAAAMLNLLNDWHIGRPLFNRWVFSLYSIYWAMALGYLLAGLAILSGWPLLSPARHILTIGAIGFSVFIVMVFASQVHSGRTPEYRTWVLLASLSLLIAVVCRIAMSLPAFASLYHVLLSLSAILWMTAFSLFIGFFWKTLIRPSADGRRGCLPDHTQNHS
ncbi:MAG TPA: hypothetical protein DD979_08795 [Gammaproteobacteria bacterium]|nr:hypothetical protein [Gammaproteobacteria bacterium]